MSMTMNEDIKLATAGLASPSRKCRCVPFHGNVRTTLGLCQNVVSAGHHLLVNKHRGRCVEWGDSRTASARSQDQEKTGVRRIQQTGSNINLTPTTSVGKEKIVVGGRPQTGGRRAATWVVQDGFFIYFLLSTFTPIDKALSVSLKVIPGL